MPNRQISESPTPEPLALRLLRDTLDEHRIPFGCPRRQCRRSRHCSGAAFRTAQPLNAGELLPACVLHAKLKSRLQFMAMAKDVLAPLDDSAEPRQWPEDTRAATRLRLSLAIIQRIHTRPGPHPDGERTALAAWQLADPDPEATAYCRRIWRHTKVPTRPQANSGAAP